MSGCFKWCVVLFLGIGALGIWSESTMTPKEKEEFWVKQREERLERERWDTLQDKRKATEDLEEGRRYTLQLALQNATNPYLKSPSDADWPWANDKYIVIKLSANVYTVGTEVDATNSFGGTIRTKVHGAFRFKPGSTDETQLYGLQVGDEWPVPIPKGGIPE